jgi:lipoic acid synthetase
MTTIAAIRETGCRYLSIGQYLAPSRRHHPVVRFIEPPEFQRYREEALKLGFSHVESGPYVRSSYHAERYNKS